MYTSYQTNREAARARAFRFRFTDLSTFVKPRSRCSRPTFMRSRHFRSAWLVSILQIHPYSDNKYLVREARDDYVLNRMHSPPADISNLTKGIIENFREREKVYVIYIIHIRQYIRLLRYVQIIRFYRYLPCLLTSSPRLFLHPFISARKVDVTFLRHRRFSG